MTFYLSVKEVIRLHYQTVANWGGAHGVRDLSLLESAVGRPRAGYGRYEVHPDLFSKTAALLQSLIKNHPFIDGNKRTALVAADVFLRRNGYKMTAPSQDLFHFALAVTNDKVDSKAITAWLQNNSQSL